MIDYDDTVLGWMDRYIRDDKSGASAPPVRYFVMGENRWRESNTWPPPGRPTTYYLSSSNSKSGRGALTATAPVASETASAIVSDPANPVINRYRLAGAHDYRALTERPDVLTFDSAPLEHDLEVSGPIAAPGCSFRATVVTPISGSVFLTFCPTAPLTT